MIKAIKYIIFVLAVSLSACGLKNYDAVEINNPVFIPNTEFKSFEDLTSPKFRHLIEKYRLDTVVQNETDEFKRILLLRHWIKSVIKIDDYGDPYPGGGYAEGILDAALKGHGFHCGHFMIVQNAIMNAFGYVTRTLGAGPGVKGGPDGHHGINEIWLNKYNKWFLSDAKYDHHFEQNGIPLSALEIRDSFLKNRAADIIKVKGPERAPFDIDRETGLSKEQNAQTYTWIEWHGYNDMFAAWPDYHELLIMYQDDFFKNHIWIWDGKPHWAYAKPEFMKLVQEKNKLYWTPNTITSKTEINRKIAHIILRSETPNLKEYQLKDVKTGQWNKVLDDFTIGLKKREYRLVFRTVNLADVKGPEHVIVIKRK